ncbi:MAG: hypothetical protein ACI9KN_000522 [Gammaproteobacteria bacterium]
MAHIRQADVIDLSKGRSSSHFFEKLLLGHFYF